MHGSLPAGAPATRILARTERPRAGAAAFRHVLVLTCPDVCGVVAAVSGYLAAHGASITESHQFNDAESGLFHMRTAFRPDASGMPPIEQLRAGFAPIADGFGMEWRLHGATDRPRLLIAVSRSGIACTTCCIAGDAVCCPWRSAA